MKTTPTPTPITTALAGNFSAIVWPVLWSSFGGSGAAGSVELIISTVLVVALPAHAFVMGFGQRQMSGAGTLDTALLKRIAAWMVAAALITIFGWFFALVLHLRAQS